MFPPDVPTESVRDFLLPPLVVMTRLIPRLHDERGYNLIEMMFVLGIMAILAGMSLVQIGTTREAMRGDAAMRVVLSQMNQARELAITQRRYMRVTFTVSAGSLNTINIVREDTTTTTTAISSVPFEGGAQFVLVSGLPDTPDAFGKTAATSFTSSSGTFTSVAGSTSVAKFSPDGTLVDWNGRTANGTVFVALPNTAMSARAVTVLGSTGRVRGYRWDGQAWKVV